MLDDLVVAQDIMRHCSGGYEDIWFYLGCEQDKTKLQKMPGWMQEMVNLFTQNGEFFQIESERYPVKLLLVYYPKLSLKDRTETKFYFEIDRIVKDAMKMQHE